MASHVKLIRSVADATSQSLIVRFGYVAATVLPSGEIATVQDVDILALSTDRTWSVPASHNVTAPRSPLAFPPVVMVAMVLPSAETTMERTGNGCLGSSSRSFQAAVSQSLTVWSSLAVTRVRPSGRKATLRTTPRWTVLDTISVPVETSQTLNDLSFDPV